jgi:hypothetical protein
MENTISHYYGDWVRRLFLVSALLSFVAIPVWGDLLQFGTFTQVSAGLLLVLLAGLTNPRTKGVMMLNSLFAAISVLLLESTAIIFRTSESWPLFIAREISGLLMLIAFYFSVKTLRAMSLGNIGKRDAQDNLERSGQSERQTFL